MSQLDYAQSSGRKRRLVRRALIVVAVIVGTILCIPLVRRELLHLDMVSAYRRCLNPTMSPQTYKEYAVGGASPATASAVFQPWIDLNRDLGSNIVSYGTIFVGELSTPDKTRRRLVGIDVIRPTQPIGLSTHARVIVGGGSLSSPHYGVASDQIVALGVSNGDLVLHAPKKDPADPSHFTIEFQTPTQLGTINGWLKDDETVVLEPDITAPAPPWQAKSP